jgi:hypothetical protein
LRQNQWGARSQRSLAPAATADLKALFSVKPPELLMVQLQAIAPKQDQKTPITKPAADRSKLPQPDPHRRIVRAQAMVPHRGAIAPMT